MFWCAWVCGVMFWYALGMYQALYECVLLINNQDMSERGHIVYTSNIKTVQHNNTWREKNNVQSQLTKRGLNQTNERPTRHDHPPIPQHRTHARLPSHHQNPQKLRCLLRTINHIPPTRHPRKERLRRQHMEHGLRTPTQNLQPHQRRTRHAQLHRRITEPNLPQNHNRKPRSRTINRHHHISLTLEQPR